MHVKVLAQQNGGVGIGDVNQKEEDNVEAEEVEAETYIWVAGADRLEPEEWDFSEFVRDKMKRWVGNDAAATDDGFQDVDNAVAALADPTGGRGANGDISKQLESDKVLESAV